MQLKITKNIKSKLSGIFISAFFPSEQHYTFFSNKAVLQSEEIPQRVI